MNWQEVCADPDLRDLPYKIELNERGQILMTPVRLYHSALQGKIIRLLIQLVQHGEAFPEFAIATEKELKNNYQRIVERLKEYFAENPLTGCKFNHYRLARYLSKQVGNLEISGDILDRFEKNCKTVNKLLVRSSS